MDNPVSVSSCGIVKGRQRIHQGDIDDMSDVLLTCKAFPVGVVLIELQPEKGVGLFFQGYIFVQPAYIDLQNEILMVIGQVHQPIQADVLTADAGFLLQLTLGGCFGSLTGLHLAADKVETALEGFLFALAEEDLIVFPVKDHDAVHDFIWCFQNSFSLLRSADAG
jgi:hypothetical protein